jgi:hypothetical protein
VWGKERHVYMYIINVLTCQTCIGEELLSIVLWWKRKIIGHENRKKPNSLLFNNICYSPHQLMYNVYVGHDKISTPSNILIFGLLLFILPQNNQNCPPPMSCHYICIMYFSQKCWLDCHFIMFVLSCALSEIIK